MNQTFLRLPFVIVLLLSLPALAWAAGVAAPVPKTGQTTQYAVADDGVYAATKGAAWPNPRFTNTNNGVVTDNLTGLIWLKNANCFGRMTWAPALTAVKTLQSGACGLTDGSALGEWRLPSKKELESLVASQYVYPVLSNTVGTGPWTAGDPFTGVRSNQWYDDYWSSTTVAEVTTHAWVVLFGDGSVLAYNKLGLGSVWPVRGGQ